MNCYEKFGREFANSLMRHLASATGVWAVLERENISWRNFVLAVLVGAVVPTIREVFAKGIPEDDPEPVKPPPP